jgi:hypothetical protein
MVAQERCMEAIGSLEHIIRYVYIYILVGGLEHFLFPIIYGMSSFPLTFIFFSGVGIPPTRPPSRLIFMNYLMIKK